MYSAPRIGKHGTEALAALNHDRLSLLDLELFSIAIEEHHAALQHAHPLAVVECEPWLRGRIGNLDVCNGDAVRRRRHVSS